MKNNKAYAVNKQDVKSSLQIEQSTKKLVENSKVEILTPAQIEEKISENGYYVYVPVFLRIRRGPGLEFEEVGLIFDNEKHYVFEEKEGWGRIGEDKWIMLQYTNRVSN